MFDIDSQVCYNIYLINKVNKMAKKKTQAQYNKTHRIKHDLISIRLKKSTVKSLADLKILLNVENQNEVTEYLIKFHEENK